MNEQVERASYLAVLLERHREAIASDWAEHVYRLPHAHYRAVSLEELRTTALLGLQALSETLMTGCNTVINDFITRASLQYLQRGFDIGEMLEALLLCKDAVLPVIWRDLDPDSPEARATIVQLDTCLRRMVSRCGQTYAEAARGHAYEPYHTALMLDMAQPASGSPELEHVLQQVAERMAAAVGVRDCAIYLLDLDRGIVNLKAGTVSPGSASLDIWRNRSLDSSQDPLLRELVEYQRVVSCFNAQTDSRVGRDLARVLGVKSILAVPISVNSRVLGIALLSTYDDYRTFTSTEIGMVRGLSGAAALAIENDRLYIEIRQRLAESQSLQQVTAALLQKLDLEEVLEIVCSQAQQLTGALGSTVFLVEDDGWLQRALSIGVAPPIADRILIDESLTGIAVRRGELLLINNPDREAQRYCWGDELTALLAVPLWVQEDVIGTLNVVNKPGGFTTEDARIIRLFAAQAAIAIENARLSQQVEHLAVMEERQRLARELHDSVTQALYSVTLHSEAALRLLAAGNREAAAGYLQELRNTAQQALREMRMLIFELRPPILEHEGLIAALQARLDAVEARAGLQSELRVTGEEQLPYAVAEELYRIAQEALNNVIKHAQAQRVTVHVRCDDPVCCLEVRDNGSGFDTNRVLEYDGWGLRGMQERAERIGGQLIIESAPGKGTRIRAEVTRHGTRGSPGTLGVLEELTRKRGLPGPRHPDVYPEELSQEA